MNNILDKEGISLSFYFEVAYTLMSMLLFILPCFILSYGIIYRNVEPHIEIDHLKIVTLMLTLLMILSRFVVVRRIQGKSY